MWKQQWISLFVVLVAATIVLGEDSVTFVAKPSSFHLNPIEDKITSVQLANVILTSMGFTVDLKNGGWSGAYITSPFNPPRIVVGLRVRDSATFEPTPNNYEVPLVENLKWDELFSILVERSEKRLDNLRSDYVFVQDEDAALQSATIMEAMSKDVVENGTTAPIVYFLDMTKTHVVIPEMDESAKKLADAVEALNGFMFVVKSSDITPHHSRRARQAPSSSTIAPVTTPVTPPLPKDMNLAEDFDEDYPIVFNIILFISLALILALIAVSVAIATMDPGRDSLIYRVTSAQRFKKDN